MICDSPFMAVPPSGSTALTAFYPPVCLGRQIRDAAAWNPSPAPRERGDPARRVGWVRGYAGSPTLTRLATLATLSRGTGEGFYGAPHDPRRRDCRRRSVFRPGPFR